jgi:hypothetical protein
VNRLGVRVAKLEAAGRRGWRAFIGRPVEQWPDEALLGFLGEGQGWPPNHEPTDAALEAIAAGRGGRVMLDAGRDAEGEP